MQIQGGFGGFLYTTLPNGDLQVAADNELRALLAEKRDEDPDAFGTEAMMGEVFESLLSNSELEWISPTVCGDQTDAPILAIMGEERPLKPEEQAFLTSGGMYLVGHYEGQTWVADPLARWGFMNYALCSPQEELLERGICVFQAAV